MKQEQIQKDKSGATTMVSNTKSQGTQMVLAIVACIILPLVIYSNSLNAPFIFDDYAHIADNPSVTGVNNFGTKLTYGPGYVVREMSMPTRPLVFWTFRLNYHLGGLDTFGYHLVNVLLHICNSILIFLLTITILFHIYKTENILLPLAVALLFASHPINTEVVTYISSRSDSLATLFYLSSLLLFVKSFEKGKWFYFISIISFALSLLCKEIAVTLPAIILISDYFLLRDCKWGSIVKRWFYHIPYWLLLIAYVIYRYFSFDKVGDLGINTYQKWNHYTYFLTQLLVITKYIKLLFVPVGQCIDHFILPAKNIFDFKIILSFTFLITMFLLIRFYYKNHSYLSKLLMFSVLWFFITLSTTSSFMPINDAMAERRLYLPGWGFSLFIMSLYLLIFNIDISALGAHALQGKYNIGKTIYQQGRINILIAFLGIHIFTFSVATWERNQLYRNPIRIWQDVIKKYPQNARAYNALAFLYVKNGDAINVSTLYEEAIKMAPNDMEAYCNLAHLCYDQKEYEKALRLFQKVIASNPNYPVPYQYMGSIFYKRQDYHNALWAYQKSIQLNVNPAEMRYNMGIVYGELKKSQKAVLSYQKAIDLNPNYVKAYNNIGIIYWDWKEYDKALRQFRKAVELDPNYADAHLNLGNMFYEQGAYGNAYHEYQIVLKLVPNNEFARERIGLLEKFKTDTRIKWK